MFAAAERFINSWRFPVVVVSILLFTVALMVGILVIPPDLGSLSAFAEDFKIWCFGFDPSTGHLEWAYVVMLTVQPLIILGVIILVWHKPLGEMIRSRPRSMLPYVFRSFLLVVVVAVTLPLVGSSRSVESNAFAFPGERLRTMRQAIPFSLTDDHGKSLNFDDLRGRVVLVTAVYASCGDTCPLILQQTKRVLDRLTAAERGDLTVVAITLNPDVDTPEIMNGLLRAHGLDGYDFRGGTGESAYVNELLDRYGFARVTDPVTGMIEHANKLIAIDRAGRVAFTFSLGEIQEEWLLEGLRLLLSERTPV